MCLDRVFDDKRLAVALLMLWMVVVIVVFKDIGLLDSKFMTFGPSVSTVFMGVTLDTWYKWNMVAGFTLVNTLINDFMSDALSPWILNTITDHKTKFIPYPKAVCLLITQCWAIYCNIMGVFGLFLAMTQIDFVLVKIMADLTVNMYTNLKFMRNKEACPVRYARSMGGESAREMSRMDEDPRSPMLGPSAPAVESCAPPQPVFCIQDEEEVCARCAREDV